MAIDDSNALGVSPRAGLFATTHWSVVLAAKEGDASQAAAALEKLCRTYWPPLYAFLRRQDYAPSEAQDMVQGFFAVLLENKGFGVADPRKGKFRSFLLGCLKHFVADQHKKAHAQKRGGGQRILSLDDASMEARYARESVPARSSEDAYARCWALTVLETALGRLREEYQAAGQGALFNQLEGFAAGHSDLPVYAEMAQCLGLSDSAVKSAIYRLRRRYRELIREEIAQTVTQPSEVDEELRYLIAVLGK